MTHLKQLSLQMRQICNPKTIVKIALVLAILCINGCKKASIDTLSIGEWIKIINQESNISTSGNSVPYFMNVTKDSPYFVDIQSATDFGILSTDYPINCDDTLTNEWVAYTLVNLNNFDLVNSNSDIKDIRTTVFPKHVTTAVSKGLMTLDKNNCFKPKKEIDRNEAMRLLSTSIEFINSRNVESSSYEIDWKDDIEVKDIEPVSVDHKNKSMTIDEGTSVSLGDHVHIKDNNDDYYLKVTDVKDDKVYYEDDNIEELTDSVFIEDSFNVDWNNIEIIDDLSDSSTNEYSYVEPTYTHLMSTNASTKSVNINGYDVSYSITASGIKASVSRQFTPYEKMVAEVSLSQLKPSYKWNIDDEKIKEGFILLDFNTNESLSFKSSRSQNRFADLSKLDSSNFIESIKSMFDSNTNVEDIYFPLCTIKVPFPNFPIMSLVVKIQLKLSVNGDCAIVLNQSHKVGFELRGKGYRTINENDNDANASINADAKLLGDILFSLNMENMKLADIDCEAGADARILSEVHLYDDERHDKVKTGLPNDYVTFMAQGVDDVLVCGDISAKWISRVKFNSKETLTGRMGLSTTIDLLDEKSGLLIPHMKTHIENGHFVDKCTRKDREKAQELETVNANNIIIDKYSIIEDIGAIQSINIKQLPTGYKKSDVVYQIDNSSVASVDNNGNVKGLSSGSAIVTISTKDGKYSIKCNILIREKNNK